MKYFIAIILILVYSKASYSQTEITYFQHIQPIIQRNCVKCHQTNGAAPFSLSTYEDVAKRSKFIGKVTQSKYMPPFPADKKFQEYLNERGLTFGEIQAIRLWIENGAKKGEETITPQNIQKSYDQSVTPDLNIKMSRVHKIEGNNKDDFRFFSIPTHLAGNQHIRSIKFTPGNRKVVHHSRIMIDTTNQIREIDGLSELDPKIKDFQKISLKDGFLHGWVPGNDQISFPKGMGRRINANSDVILNIHYAPSPIEKEDQSSIQFYFAKDKIEREVETLILRENDITNQPFFLPKETKPTFFISKKVDEDISVISIMPHMHLLGKSIKVVAITPDGDVINLVKINNWDFDWQMTYQFKRLIYLPKNALILVEATYDNTSENPENPSQPATDVGYGWGTYDEMLNVVMYYVPYKKGDEEIEQKND